MLGVRSLVKMCCYRQQAASPALAWAPPALSLVLRTRLGNNQEKMALWESRQNVFP